MKRVGHLMERIAHQDNLSEAFLRAARGKWHCHEVQRFAADVTDELQRMGDELLCGRYVFGPYHLFTVYDPKKRTICAAPFRDRVAMHAMMRICHPVFEQYQTFDSYASRIGKGTYKALERLQHKMRGQEWFLKLDVCHYFDSIHHEVMLEQLHRLFKDPQLMAYFEQLIHGYHTTSPDRGLPIGNLTSQYFANHYLAVADHYVREQLHAAFAMRYMDDVLMLHRDRCLLLQTAKAYRQYVEQELQLSLHPVVMNRCRFGVPFLGYVVYGRGMRLNQRSRRRLSRRLSGLSADLCGGRVSEGGCRERMQALYAFAEHADVTALKRNIIDRQGLLP